MSGNRQRTLFESWRTGGQGGAQNRVNESGQGGNFRRPSSIANTSKRGRGQTHKRGNGRGGRGAGKTAAPFQSKYQCNTILIDIEDEEDEICQKALGLFEMSNAEVSREFAELNEATELPGFDDNAGTVWIYPTNNPVRDYQFNIVKTALFNNTLVSLPTGLGKTFIAAVVMYNLHRWYPNDVIIFMAPTRPLVTQQLEACHNIVGIKPSQTVELTGQIVPKKRDELWKTKTVFFLTPQVMTSDLARGSCPVGKVRCLVVDEAHKAMGNHAYVQVISKVAENQKQFRVLALSATPGNDIMAVQQVFKNLIISRVELRSEDSADILPYTHQKSIEKIVVALDNYIISVREKLQYIFQLYTGKLMKLNVLFGRDGSSFTKFQLIKARELFRINVPPGIANYQKGYIESDFVICMSLSHSLELLSTHGLRSCYFFLQGIFDKERGHAVVSAELRKSVALRALLNEIQAKLNISLQNSTMNLSSSALFTTFTDVNDSSHYVPVEGKETDYTLSHPKMRVLKDIIIKHFQAFVTTDITSRVMVFSQYRDSVQEISAMLTTLGPPVKPMIFIGQAKAGVGGAGLNQKLQGEVLQKFRTGDYNVLVATCVGEEGLDIGEVDLIVCFDASRSPTRLVQRMGRTGRQRKGKTIFLLTEGKEERTYNSSISMQACINKNITDISKLQPYLYQHSPRMVPLGVEPICYKMTIVLSSEREDYKDETTKTKPKRQTDLEFTKPQNPLKKGTTKASKKPKINVTATSSTTDGSKNAQNNLNNYFSSSRGSPTALPKNIPNKTPKAPPTVITIEDDDNGDVEYDYFQFDRKHCDMEYQRVLCDLFEIKDHEESCAPCLYIPPLPDIHDDYKTKAILGKSELLLDSFELQCLQEKIDTMSLIGSRSGMCECGNSNGNCEDFCDSNSPMVIVNNSKCNGTTSAMKKKKFHFKASSNPSKISQQSVFVTTNKSFTDSTLLEYSDNFEETNRDTIYADKELAFLFEDYACFEDDWMGEPEVADIVLENNGVVLKGSSPNNSINELVCLASKDRRQITSNHHSSSQIANKDNKQDFVEPPKEKVDAGFSVENYNANQFSSDSKQMNSIPSTARHTRTEMRALFKDDEILFEDDDDYVESENNSTTSNEEFGTPVRKGHLNNIKIITTPKIQASDSSTTSNDFSSPVLRTQDVIDSKPEKIQTDSPSVDWCSFGEDIDFVLMGKTLDQEINVEKCKVKNMSFNMGPLMQSTPKKSSSAQLTENRIESDNSDDMFSASPDLSQYRLQNRIKRAKLDSDDLCELSSTYARMTAPGNDSADILNRYVEEMRRQSQMESENDVQGNDVHTSVGTSTTVAPLNSMKPFKMSNCLNRIPEVTDAKTKFLYHNNATPQADDGQKKFVFNNATRQPDEGHENNTFNNSTAQTDKAQKNFTFKNSTTPQVDAAKKKKFVFKKRSNDSTLQLSNTPILASNVPEFSVPTFRSTTAGSSKIIDKDIQFNRIDKSKLPLNSVNKLVQVKTSFADKAPLKTYKSGTICNSPWKDNNTLQTSSMASVGAGFSSRGNNRVSIKSKFPGVSMNVSRHNYDVSTTKETHSVRNFPHTADKSNIRDKNSVRRFQLVDISEFSDDDDFDFAKPVPKTTKTQKPEGLQIIPTPKPVRVVKVKRKLPKNPYLEYEAEVSGDSCSDEYEEDDLDSIDDLDQSFVTQAMNNTITDSQQVRYAESVKDVIPIPCGRVERPLTPTTMDNLNFTEYEGDSFCVPNDEVEFAETGAFTQAMNKAKKDIDREESSDWKRRRTRYAEKQKRQPTSNNVKKRRRVFMLDSSDED